MKVLRILTALGFAVVIASPVVAAPRKHQGFANPEASFASPGVLGARAQAPWISAPGGADYVGTDPDQTIRSELQRDPPSARQ